MGAVQSLLRPQGSGQIDPSRRKFDDNVVVVRHRGNRSSMMPKEPNVEFDLQMTKDDLVPFHNANITLRNPKTGEEKEHRIYNMTTEQVKAGFVSDPASPAIDNDKFESARSLFETIKKHSHAETVTIIEIKGCGPEAERAQEEGSGVSDERVTQLRQEGAKTIIKKLEEGLAGCLPSGHVLCISFQHEVIEALEKSPLFTDQGMKGGMLFYDKDNNITPSETMGAERIEDGAVTKISEITEYLKDKDVRSGGVALEDKLILDASGADLEAFLDTVGKDADIDIWQTVDHRRTFAKVMDDMVAVKEKLREQGHTGKVLLTTDYPDELSERLQSNQGTESFVPDMSAAAAA